MHGQCEVFITVGFTSQRYGGNQLATFVDCESLSDCGMQQIAKEINFSKTTLIALRQPRDGEYDVCAFTPKSEMEVAVHPFWCCAPATCKVESQCL